MSAMNPLHPSKLRASIDPESIACPDSTHIPEKNTLSPVHPRAVEALALALAIDDPGYNVYVCGEPDLGRTYLVTHFLRPRAAKMKTPPDYVYTHNFTDPDSPQLFTLPAGQAQALKKRLTSAIRHIRKNIPKQLTQEAFTSKGEALYRSYQNTREALLETMHDDATRQGFDLNLDEQGAMTLYPLMEGKVISEAEYERLDPETRAALKEKGDGVLAGMARSLRQITKEEKIYRKQQRELETSAIRDILKTWLSPVAKQFKKHKGMTAYFRAMHDEIVEHIELLLPPESDPVPSGLAEKGAIPSAQSHETTLDDFFSRFTVNRFVDNCCDGAPLIIEDHPTLPNLLGCIERESEMGALYTDFTLIKAGALHKANHGFLVLHMDDILHTPEAWEGLLRALRAGQARIEDPADNPDQSRTKTISPAPIPLHVKVILIGTDDTYESLLAMDERFSKLFKIKAHMQETIARTAASITQYLHALGRIIDEAGLKPFDRAALAELINYSSRMAEDQTKLSLRLPLVRELMIEASAMAKRARSTLVTREILHKAERGRVFRANLYEEEFLDDYDRELIKVATDGDAVGRANGLSVTMAGDYVFGLPHQIACTVGVGQDGILDLEREAELSGPIHTKAMMILKSYLIGLFAQDKPLLLTGSLCFEQSYAQVEGDSASGVELAALLSALADVPVTLSLAFTGAVNQSGAILAVGGVTPKVEGFFQVCKRRGLTGKQGVLIPADNVPHLMLRDEVVDAVANKQFHIYPVHTIAQAMELLTQMPAGKQNKKGAFPQNTLYHRVNNRLAKLTTLAQPGK